jgi:hypothetical protein
MVPSQRACGSAAGDPLNYEGTRLSTHKAGALFPVIGWEFRVFYSRRKESLATKSWPGEPRPTLPRELIQVHGRPEISKGRYGAPHHFGGVEVVGSWFSPTVTDWPAAWAW